MRNADCSSGSLSGFVTYGFNRPPLAGSDDPRAGRKRVGALSGKKEDHGPGYAVRVIDALRPLGSASAAGLNSRANSR